MHPNARFDWGLDREGGGTRVGMSRALKEGITEARRRHTTSLQVRVHEPVRVQIREEDNSGMSHE